MGGGNLMDRGVCAPYPDTPFNRLSKLYCQNSNHQTIREIKMGGDFDLTTKMGELSAPPHPPTWEGGGAEPLS